MVHEPGDRTWSLAQEQSEKNGCHRIKSRILSSNGIPRRCRPIRTIFPFVREPDWTSWLLDSGESRISKTSRTPCTILTSPFDTGSLAFNLCASMLPRASPFVDGTRVEGGNLESQRIDLSQASSLGSCSTCKTGTLIVTVAMVCTIVSS